MALRQSGHGNTIHKDFHFRDVFLLMQGSSETKMFILTDAKNNNNKFWEISIDGSGTVATRNGRVGSKGQSRVLGNGRRLFDSKIREKERGGYKPIDLVGAPASAANINGEALVTAAEEQIGQGNPVVIGLVRELAKINRHQILAASGGQMDLDLSTGVISTPVGVVTGENVARARAMLQGFEGFVSAGDFDNPAFIHPLEQYLMLVPQKVGSRRGWHRDFIRGLEDLVKQSSLLDQLESSIEIAEQRVKDAKMAGDKPEIEKIFDVAMRISEDGRLRNQIQDFFEKGRQRMHASRDLKMARIFEVSLGGMNREFAEDGETVGGIRQLWHGTRAHNLISILKSGLIIPKSNGSIHVTGRMFGDGLYFSDQSTKSLNYAYGYWDRGARDDRCYMFLADVAMGKSWHPNRTGSNVRPPAGYDSVFARGGQDIVHNNEMIVYRTSQAKLNYLVEFEA